MKKILEFIDKMSVTSFLLLWLPFVLLITFLLVYLIF